MVDKEGKAIKWLDNQSEAYHKAIEKMTKGRIPKELFDENIALDVALIDKSGETYKSPFIAYSGNAGTIGGSAHCSKADDIKLASVKVEDDEETTTLKIRFNNGKVVKQVSCIIV